MSFSRRNRRKCAKNSTHRHLSHTHADALRATRTAAIDAPNAAGVASRERTQHDTAVVRERAAGIAVVIRSMRFRDHGHSVRRARGRRVPMRGWRWHAVDVSTLRSKSMSRWHPAAWRCPSPSVARRSENPVRARGGTPAVRTRPASCDFRNHRRRAQPNCRRRTLCAKKKRRREAGVPGTGFEATQWSSSSSSSA